MARTYFCPRCLQRIGEDEVRYQDRRGTATEKPKLTYARSWRDWTSALWQGAPEPIYRIDAQARADSFELGVVGRCPRGHRVPEHAFDVPSIVIAMVGESAAGKTVYLGTLLEHLDRGRLLPYLDFAPDEHSARLQDQVFGEFYRNNRVPHGTARSRDEFQREAITHSATSDGQLQFYVSFFDASGEENTREDIGTRNQFLFAADVVMHFLTPEVLGLAKRTAHRRPDQLQQWHVTNRALHAATNASEPGSHAAVIVPKSDDIDPAALGMLKDARAELDYGSGLTLHRAYDIITQDSYYIRSLLRQNEDGRVLVDRIESRHRSASYHLVSATGGPADEQTNRFPRRRPQRVLDPLLASLVSVDALSAREGRRALR